MLLLLLLSSSVTSVGSVAPGEGGQTASRKIFYNISNEHDGGHDKVGPCTWNSLPAHIRSIDTLSTFKRHLKFHIFQSAFTV